MSGTVAESVWKYRKCQLHSSPVKQIRPMAGRSLIRNNRATTNRSIKRSRAIPNTADGSGKDNRNVAMISRRNGSAADATGSWTANSLLHVASLSVLGVNFRASQTPTTTKKTENDPRRMNDVDNPTSDSGTLRINTPVAANVNKRTASAGRMDVIIVATPIATKSTKRMKGHTRSETSGN